MIRKTSVILAVTIGIALFAAAMGQGKQPDIYPDATVTLSLATPASPGVIERARFLATSMFAAIGITLGWRIRTNGRETKPARESEPGLSIHVLMTADDSEPANSGALAEAFPFDGSSRGITINYDRVRSSAGTSKELEAMLLAHVLVHEITHVLQCLDRHSDTGVMKARWTVDDYIEMKWKPLPFTPEDVDLIRLGLKAWHQGFGGCR